MNIETLTSIMNLDMFLKTNISDFKVEKGPLSHLIFKLHNFKQHQNSYLKNNKTNKK